MSKPLSVPTLVMPHALVPSPEGTRQWLTPHADDPHELAAIKHDVAVSTALTAAFAFKERAASRALRGVYADVAASVAATVQDISQYEAQLDDPSGRRFLGSLRGMAERHALSLAEASSFRIAEEAVRPITIPEKPKKQGWFRRS